MLKTENGTDGPKREYTMESSGIPCISHRLLDLRLSLLKSYSKKRESRQCRFVAIAICLTTHYSEGEDLLNSTALITGEATTRPRFPLWLKVLQMFPPTAVL